MNSYVSHTIKGVPPSSIRKFFDIVSTTDNAISLSIGEPDFATPWHIRESTIESHEKGHTTYTSNHVMPQLKNAIAKYLKEKIHVEYSGEREILVTVGASEGIYDALRALCDPGDEVLFVEPSYVSYKPFITMCGAIPVVLICKAENEFRLTPENLREKLTHKAKVRLFRGFDSEFFASHKRHTEIKTEDVEANDKLRVLSTSAKASLFAAGDKEDY